MDDPAITTLMRTERVHVTTPFQKSATLAESRSKTFLGIFCLGPFLSYPPGQTGIVNRKAFMTTDQQLELGLGGEKPAARIARREDRMARAAWWFNKMRAVVNGAMDWPPAGQPRPQQEWLPGAYRQVRI